VRDNGARRLTLGKRRSEGITKDRKSLEQHFGRKQGLLVESARRGEMASGNKETQEIARKTGGRREMGIVLLESTGKSMKTQSGAIREGIPMEGILGESVERTLAEGINEWKPGVPICTP
jgi:hypothetical protein